MARYLQVVTTRPHPGAEDQFNHWYDTVHLPEVLTLDGVVSAHRFTIAHPTDDDGPQYVALYELETEDLTATLAYLDAALDTLTMSSALDVDATDFRFYRPLGSWTRSAPDG